MKLTPFQEQVFRFFRVSVFTLVPILITQGFISDRLAPIAVAIVSLITGAAEVAFRAKFPVQPVTDEQYTIDGTV